MPLTTQNGQSISTLPLFDGVEAALLQVFLSSASLSHLDKGEVLLRAEEPILRYALILEGWACLRKGNADGQESVLHIFGPQDFLPEPDRENRNPYRGNVEALTPVSLLNLPAAAVKSLCERSAAFNANLLRLAAQRTQQLLDHIEHLTLRDAEHRVGWFILRMRDLTGTDKQNITLPFEKSVIASYLGIKPETLSRALQQLRENGIGINRNKVSLPHPRALCAYCDTQIAQRCEHVDAHDCPFTHTQPHS